MRHHLRSVALLAVPLLGGLTLAATPALSELRLAAQAQTPAAAPTAAAAPAAPKDKSPAKWTVADGILSVDKKAGNIETKRSFKNYQLHIEWRVPEGITGTGQSRGNSGVFLASTGAGDGGYELQVLDS